MGQHVRMGLSLLEGKAKRMQRCCPSAVLAMGEQEFVRTVQFELRAEDWFEMSSGPRQRRPAPQNQVEGHSAQLACRHYVFA